MSGVNKVMIIGHLGADPELRTVSNGNTVARLNVATSENWTDREGQRHEKTEWHRIVVWGKQAEICGKFLSKGRQVYIEGRLQTRSWEDQNNQKKYTTEIIANNVQFLGAQTSSEATGSNFYGSSQKEDRRKSYTAASTGSTASTHNTMTGGTAGVDESQMQDGTKTVNYESSGVASKAEESSTGSSSSLKKDSTTSFDKNEEIPF